jgi:hypothetical protein
VSAPATAAPPETGRRPPTWFYVAALVVTLLLAGVASTVASDDPDGLERVAEDEGFDRTALDHTLDGSPVADYELSAVDDERLAVGLAGVLGVVLTLVVAGGLFLAVRRPGSTSTGRGRPHDPATGAGHEPR